MADRLWRLVDLRGIDRVVVGIGEQSVGFANWLLRVFDFRIRPKEIPGLEQEGEVPNEVIQELEPQTLQHHLLVMIFWLIIAIALLYWLAV